MASSENAPTTGPTRRRGRPRRVLFEEVREPNTPNNVDNAVPRQEPQEPIRQVPNERRRRVPPRNEPVAEQLLALLRQALNQDRPQEQHGRRQEEESDDKMLTRFLRFNPPRFDGKPDDRKAEFWLAEVEKIFRVLNYPDPQKVRYATYLFEGAACHWWVIVERRWERDEIVGTWARFREEFLKRYIPQVVRDLREKEFMRLIQGSLTVAKYEAEFNRLIQHAPHILAG